MADHLCACSGCDPQLSVVLAAQPGHFNIKHPGAYRLSVFKAIRLEATPLAAAEREFINSEENISHYCWQVITGTGGSAWRYSDPVHFCHRCHQSVCAYVDHGDFRVAG